jgi:dTMP kinase
MLFYAARHDHVARLIEPALAAGEWIVCDRFADSTIAYQGYGRGFSLTDLETLQRIALSGLKPDLTLILDISVSEGMARVGGRSMIADRFETLERDFHERLRQGFLEIAAREPERCVVIDAAGDMTTVHHAILGAVNARFGVSLT